MGGIGAVAEPLVVIILLFGGTWINRNFDTGRKRPQAYRRTSEGKFLLVCMEREVGRLALSEIGLQRRIIMLPSCKAVVWKYRSRLWKERSSKG